MSEKSLDEIRDERVREISLHESELDCPRCYRDGFDSCRKIMDADTQKLVDALEHIALGSMFRPADGREDYKIKNYDRHTEIKLTEFAKVALAAYEESLK